VAERAALRAIPIDWGALSPLRLRARVVAEGLYAGTHRSARRGSGVEFGGQRPYVPGDDLRFLDRRSLLRHDRLLVREFETDTDRALWLCLDASASMAFRSARAPGAKLAYAALLAAALARIALAGRDPVGLAWIGSPALGDVQAGTGVGTYERVVGNLEQARAGGDLSRDAHTLESCARLLAERARRGSVVVVLSDLLDLPPVAEHAIGALGAGGRALVLVQVLDPVERDLGYHGKVRLRALEGDAAVVTDVDLVRDGYRKRLAALQEAWRSEVHRHGGRLVLACTSDDATAAARAIVQAIGEARRR
jgi:uncharacterized protein (DUF58 family)